MAKQITAEMATNLTLDVSRATKSLNELSRSVKQSTNEWKVQEQQMKQAGDAVGASEAKFKGLSNVVDTQKSKVEALKHALATNNTETVKGQKQQEFLTAELAKAERQLNSYQGQLDKATQAYKYQSSGLSKLNDEIKHSTDLTTARVSRLEAEGKTTEANKVKQQGLSEALGKYNSVLKIQQSELLKIAESTGKSSDEYRKQQLRIEQTGAKIANLSADIRHLNGEEIKPNLNGLNLAKTKLEQLNEVTKKTNHAFRNIFLGNLVANGVSNALSNMYSQFSQLIENAKEYNKEQQVMNATWNTLTGSASKGKVMVDSINQISTAFGQSADLTNELEQQFYHVFNQKGPTDELTKSVLTLSDTLGMSAEDTKRLGLNFTHMLSSGRLQLGDFNMITDQLPMYGEKLLEFEQEAQHNTSLTMSELRKQMSAGKISADDATKVMNELGVKYKNASENMINTASGMERVISARSKALTGALLAPIMNAKNPIFGAVSKWVSDKRTESEFGKVGQSITKALSTVTDAFGKSFKGKDFTETADKMLNNLAKNIERLGNFIAKNKDEIMTFFGAIKTIGGVGFTTLGVSLKIALPLLESFGSFAAKHKTLVNTLAVAFVGYNLALKGTLLGLNKLNAFKGLFIKPRVDSSDAERNLTLLGTIVKATTLGVTKALKFSVSIATTVAKKALQGLIITANLAGKALKVAFTFAKDNPLGLIITAIGLVVASLIELYRHNAKFKKFINGLVASAKVFFDGAIQWFDNFFNDAADGFNTLYKNVSKIVGSLVKDMIRIFKNLFDTLSDTLKIFTDLFTGKWDKLSDDIKKVVTDLIKIIKSYFKLGYDYLNTLTGGFVKKITGSFTTLSSTIGKVTNSMWARLTNLFKVGFNTVKQLMKVFSDFFTGNWRGLSKDVSKVITSLWSNVKKIFSQTFTWLDKLTGGWLSRTTKGFSNFGKGVARIFNSMWGSIKKFAKSGINDVIGIINGGISGIDGVISDFGGPKQAIGLIPKFANGTDGAPKGLAMVNDEKGVSDAREAIIDKSGDVHILSGKNRVVNFSGGETVIPAETTRQMFPHFSKGTKGWLNKVNKGVSNVVDSAKRKFADIAKFLENPLESISKIMSNVINGSLGDTSTLVSSLTPALGSAFSKAIIEPIKNLLGKLKDADESSDPGGSVKNPGGSGVQRWSPYVKKALSALNLSTSSSMIAKVLRQIQTESGGNAGVTQHGYTDINTLTGNLAKGLMQVIPPTFNAYKLPGHGNILNGYDNILAGLNYAKHRYGDNLSFLGQGHGYANGGLITKHQIAEIGEGNKPEMIIPLSGIKSSRGFELLGKTAVAMAARDGASSSISNSSGVGDDSDVIKQLKQAVDLLTQLVVGQNKQSTDVNVVLDKNDLYKKQASDVNLRDYQSLA